MSLKDKIIGQLGFGSAPLGNMFRELSEAEATATVEAAWHSGIRFFDTAPGYGAGLSEERLGKALSGFPRDAYSLSSKVGRVITDELETESASGPFAFGRKNKIIFDYSSDATLRTIEGSLKRLNTDRLDVVWVHDVAQDTHGDNWLEQFHAARDGAFKALTRLREEGVIKGWGLGVNRIEPCELALDLVDSQLDGFLLAGRYTLLDHKQPLRGLMESARRHNAEFVVGGPYSSGVLVGGKHFEYQPASEQVLQKVDQIIAIAGKFGVDVKSAALQFALANPLVAAVIPGASRPERLDEDNRAFNATVPVEFWAAMKSAGLIEADAPVPV